MPPLQSFFSKACKVTPVNNHVNLSLYYCSRFYCIPVPVFTALQFPFSLHFCFLITERQKESGLSIKSFCTNEGIAPSTFYYWQKKLRKESRDGRFIPLLVRGPGSTAYPASGQMPAPGMDHTPLEITYPNGTTLRIRQTLDMAGLRSLVSLLD